MEALRTHLQRIRIRFAISAAIYVVFLVMAVSYGLSPQSQGPDRLAVTLCTLLGALLALPRRTMPAAMPRATTEEQHDEIALIRAELRRYETQAMFTRIAYLALGALAALAVPALFT